MARPSTVIKRTCFVEADFHVGDNGSVKLVDPPDRRLRHGKCNGNPVVTFAGQTYFIADLVARAHLNSKHGFISFKDGNPENCTPGNIIVTDDPDADRDRIAARMARKREPVPLRHDPDRLWWREDHRTQQSKRMA